MILPSFKAGIPSEWILSLKMDSSEAASLCTLDRLMPKYPASLWVGFNESRTELTKNACRNYVEKGLVLT